MPSIDATSSTTDPRRLDQTNDAQSTIPSASSPPREIDPHSIVTSKDHDDWLGAYMNRALGVATPAIANAPQNPAQTRLDAYRAAFGGPYRIGEQSVFAPPQFRMASGFNDASARYSRDKDGRGTIDPHSPQVKVLLAACAKANAPYPQSSLMGCPSAHDLVRVTQALIDAGHLPDGPGDVATRIKAMQWKFGIGIDCTDYVTNAALTATGKFQSNVRFGGGPMPGNDYFKKVDDNPHLKKVEPLSAKPGDVVCLDGSNGDVGHRAVVFSNEIADAEKIGALAHDYGSRVGAFSAGGPVHIFQVDSSWGAGPDGASSGGVRRDTWLFNESSKQWAQISPRGTTQDEPVFNITKNGPADDLLHGFYRFK